MLSSLFVWSCGSGGLESPKPDAADQSCNDQGIKRALGESFKVDCNTCTCTKSGIACTLMACEHFTGGSIGSTGGVAGSGGAVGSGGVVGRGGAGGRGGSGAGGAMAIPDASPEGCVQDGHTYAVGETFKRDCNTCTCAATGAVCTEMACPVDAGAERPSDGGDGCFVNGQTYASGESFKSDCNTCSCLHKSVTCTAMACFHDAGADLPSTVDAPLCALSSNLTFGHDGGNALYWDSNRLTSTSFTVTRNYNGRANPDGAASVSCSPPLPACGLAGAVTIATINADLANSDVQSVWGLPQNPTPVFGVDQRPVDGTVYSIALDDGHKVLVGGQCASPVMSSCRYIPAGLVQLVQDLQKLASAMMADPVCKSAL
jgi:hypothetical protein